MTSDWLISSEYVAEVFSLMRLMMAWKLRERGCGDEGDLTNTIFNVNNFKLLHSPSPIHPISICSHPSPLPSLPPFSHTSTGTATDREKLISSRRRLKRRHAGQIRILGQNVCQNFAVIGWDRLHKLPHYIRDATFRLALYRS